MTSLLQGNVIRAAEPTNQERGLRGGAILIGKRFRKRAEPRETAIRFDWQA